MTRQRAPLPPAQPSDWGASLRRLLIAPHKSIVEIGQLGRAQLLAVLSLVFSGAILLAFLFRPESFTGFFIILGITLVSYALSRTRFFNLGALLFTFGLVLYPFISIVLGTSADFESTITTFIPLTLILAGVILTRNSYLVIGLAATLLTFLSPYFSQQPLDSGMIRVGGVILTTAVVILSVNIYRENLERTRLDQVQGLNRELEKIKNELENRVEERTAELAHRTEELGLRSQDLENANLSLQRRSTELEAIANVSRSISAIRELETLLPQVSRMISELFGFYHTGIFLLDEAGKFAILRAANSAGGQKMLARGHRLEVGAQGIVGFVTEKGKPRIALDVGSDAVFFNNPDLPETHSEMALPLKSGEKIIGALDVQSTVPNAFGQEDVELLSVLADQVSLAIENARLFEEAQRSLAEAESFSRQYLQAGWSRIASQQQLIGFRYDTTGSAPLREPVGVAPDSPTNGSSLNQVSIPIELRGEVIGELVVHTPPGKKWSQDELDMIKAVADRVALSAENARLFDETSRRAERERMVSEITSKIRSSNDPREMIKLAVQELQSALGVNRIEVIPQRVQTDSKAQGA